MCDCNVAETIIKSLGHQDVWSCLYPANNEKQHDISCLLKYPLIKLFWSSGDRLAVFVHGLGANMDTLASMIRCYYSVQNYSG